MARYKTIDQETWFPAWAKGKSLPVTALKLRNKDGSKTTIEIPTQYQYGGGFEFDVTDPWTIHLMEADPRFTRIS